MRGVILKSHSYAPFRLRKWILIHDMAKYNLSWKRSILLMYSGCTEVKVHLFLNSSKNHLFLSEKSSFGRFSDKICYTKSLWCWNEYCGNLFFVCQFVKIDHWLFYIESISWKNSTKIFRTWRMPRGIQYKKTAICLPYGRCLPTGDPF